MQLTGSLPERVLENALCCVSEEIYSAEHIDTSRSSLESKVETHIRPGEKKRVSMKNLIYSRWVALRNAKR